MLDKKCWSPQFTKQPRSHSICIIHNTYFKPIFVSQVTCTYEIFDDKPGHVHSSRKSPAPCALL